jgi:hypothetical protein
MGKIKHSEKNGKTHVLTEREINILKTLNLALNLNTLKDKCFSQFLYYICTARFGYSETANLMFEIDLDNEKRELVVKEIPDEEIQKALKDATAPQ